MKFEEIPLNSPPLVSIINDLSESDPKVFDSWNMGSIKASSLRVFGALRAETLVSVVLVLENPEAFEIVALGTRLESRKKGSMEGLMGFLMRKLPLNHKALWIEVSHKNEPALALYRKLGFKEVGKRENYYEKGDHALLLSYKET